MTAAFPLNSSYADTAILIHNRFFECGDTGITRQMPLRHGCGIVNDHARMMEQRFYNIYSVLWVVEMLRCFLNMAVCIGDGNIVPPVDIDFLIDFLCEL